MFEMVSHISFMCVLLLGKANMSGSNLGWGWCVFDFRHHILGRGVLLLGEREEGSDSQLFNC